MTGRPALGTTAALFALLALTACQASPEAGHPHPPGAWAVPPTRTPTRSSPSTPAWSPEEQAAIAAAKARYTTAQAAVIDALDNPATTTRAQLLQAGVGGNWIIRVLGDMKFYQDRGWHLAGKVVVLSTSVESVKLEGQQPEVRLNVCTDSSKSLLRYQATGKPVPAIPANGDRHKAQAVLVYAPPIGQTKKTWFLIDEKGSGSC
jgi:hypothetical protein